MMAKKQPALGAKKPKPTANLQPTPNFFRYRYLMGAMQQIALTQTVRLACIPDDVQRIPEITQAWRAASARMTELAGLEGGVPDKIAVEAVPKSLETRLAE